mmetsp:Transcript_19829/g.42901  ORF Transcript_19829/g.42901 Transcript_19829/m.42901 type:complete len:229 (-) Transcript_19829:61-747(-)
MAERRLGALWVPAASSGPRPGWEVPSWATDSVGGGLCQRQHEPSLRPLHQPPGQRQHNAVHGWRLARSYPSSRGRQYHLSLARGQGALALAQLDRRRLSGDVSNGRCGPYGCVCPQRRHARRRLADNTDVSEDSTPCALSPASDHAWPRCAPQQRRPSHGPPRIPRIPFSGEGDTIQQGDSVRCGGVRVPCCGHVCADRRRAAPPPRLHPPQGPGPHRRHESGGTPGV